MCEEEIKYGANVPFFLTQFVEKKLSRFPNSFIYRDLCIFLVRHPCKRTIQLIVDANGQVRVHCARGASVRSTIKS